MSLHRGSRRLKKLYMPGIAPTRFLMHRGRQIFPCKEPIPLPQAQFRIVDDSSGKWFEIGFQSAEELTGDADVGWQDPRGYLEIQVQHSENLIDWTTGGCLEVAGYPAYSAGWWQYWARLPIPQRWLDIQSDLRITSDRYGKSITALNFTAALTPISLPNFPYAMPADAATLEADLISEGYVGSEVTVTSAALVAKAYNHTQTKRLLPVTMTGTNVTAVHDNGSFISLPGYPYSMPSQRATLQADLRAAGKTYAVVTLYADQWDILIPDLPHIRTASITFTPGDPFAGWDFYGNYTGEQPANTTKSTEENLRNPGGDPLLEAAKQFARIAITRGPRVLP